MEHKEYKLAAVMFTDIVGFSRMMEEDEAGTLKTMEVHNQIIRDLVAAHRGKVIKTIGDAFLADFPTALDAVRCSLAVQEGMRDYSASGQGKPLTLRIGVHLGDIYFYENDALGEGINIASRLQSSARPGYINISREVYSQVSGKLPMRVNNLGQLQLKNISREIHAYEIIPGNEAEAPAPAPADTEPAAAPQRVAGDFSPSGHRRGSPHTHRSASAEDTDDFAALRREWRNIRRTVKQEWDTHLKEELKTSFQEIGKELSEVFGSRKNADPQSVFLNYKKKTLKEAQQTREGLWGHVGSFLGVNATLIFINFAMPGTTIPWSFVVILSWGIGLASHLASLRPAKQTEEELHSLEMLSPEETRELKNHQKARLGFWTHLSSNSMVIALLMFINFVMPGTDIPWSFIPGLILGLGMAGHAAGYPAQKKRFKEFWNRIRGKGATVTAANPGEPPQLAEARRLKDQIFAQLDTFTPGSSPLGEDIRPVVDNYIKQLEELVKIEGEIGGILQGLETMDLEKEEELLKAKLERQPSEVLRLEYNRSLFELEKQKKSFTDLKDQQELLELRINSGVKSLRSLQMDLARMKGTGQEISAWPGLKSRSEELNQYIEDYREGLKEI